MFFLSLIPPPSVNQIFLASSPNFGMGRGRNRIAGRKQRDIIITINTKGTLVIIAARVVVVLQHAVTKSFNGRKQKLSLQVTSIER